MAMMVTCLDSGSVAHAGEPMDGSSEVMRGRFVMDDVQLHAHPERASVDGRFRVQSRLQC